MAQQQTYVPPEADVITRAPKPVNAPVDLMRDTNGYVSVKMFFNEEQGIPRGLPMAPPRTQTFSTVGGVRQDDGILAWEATNASAELLRTGLANANGHEWGIINANWWKQPITNPKARKRFGDTQFVVMMTWCAHPNVEGRDPIMRLSRQTVDDLRILARSTTWGAVTVWNNVNNGQRMTINLRSPKMSAFEPAERLIVVRGGCLDIIPISAK